MASPLSANQCIWARLPASKDRDTETQSPPGIHKGHGRDSPSMARWGQYSWSTERLPAFPPGILWI